MPRLPALLVPLSAPLVLLAASCTSPGTEGSAAEDASGAAEPASRERAAPRAEPPAPVPEVGTLFRSIERFTLEAGGRGEAERGVLFVPLRRDDPDAGRVALEFYRFPAREGAPEGLPPVFELEGGPGFGGLGDELRDADGYYETYIRPFTRYTDYVSVGQRGFGASKPALRCGGSTEAMFDVEVPLEERMRTIRRVAGECRRYWEGRGIDLEGFTVLEAADDVADVARALGYDSLALWGISFGSHWAMAVMRRHPELVARAMLSGLEGPDHTYDMPSGVLAALERAAADAEASPELRDRIPEGGLLVALRETIERLEREPVEVPVALGGPEGTGGDGVDSVTVRIDAELVRRMADEGFSAPPEGAHPMASWPADLLALIRGDYEALAREVADPPEEPETDPGARWEYLPSASYFTYDCGSGISRARRAELESDPAVALIGSQTWLYDAGCPAFDVDLGESFRTEFSTDVPSVLVHGTWDTSTPYRNAEELVPAFRNGRLIPVERGTHPVVFRAFRDGAPEVLVQLREALLAWIARGETTGLPERVELPPVAWTVPEGG